MCRKSISVTIFCCQKSLIKTMIPYFVIMSFHLQSVHKQLSSILFYLLNNLSIYNKYNTCKYNFEKKHFNIWLQLTNRQTAWNDVQCLTKMRKITLHHNVRHLGQSEDLIFWVSLVMRTCNVWRNKLSRHFVGHRMLFQVVSIC